MVCQKKYFFKKYIAFNYWWLGLLLISLAACNNNSKVPGHSPAFQRIENHVDTLFGTNRLNEGLRLLDSAVQHMSNLTLDDQYRAYALHYVYYKSTAVNNRKALAYADTMLTIAKQNTDKRQYVDQFVDANLAMGDAYFGLGEYNQAYQHMYQGYIVGKNNLNKGALSDYMYRMGMIIYKIGNYKLAKEYFKKSYNYNTIIPHDFVNFYRIQELLDNIALSYKHNNQLDSAIIYFDKSLAFINKNGPQFTDKPGMIDKARGVVYGNKAEVYTIQGNYQQAIELLKKSVQINLQKDFDNNDAELSEIKLAKLYHDHNLDTELFAILKAIGGQLKTVKNDEVEADWNQLMSQYYFRKHDDSKSLAYLQAYNTVNDSNTKKLALLQKSDINKQLDNFEKQQQIEELSSNNKIQRIVLLVIILLAIMASVIILLIYRNWKRSKKDVLMVKQLNQQINEKNSDLEHALNEINISSQEKDRILRTVAHDLRNPIGGIASLTSIMADEEYTDEQKELINLVKETSYNSLELINEILEATNISSIELNLEAVEINSLVNNSVELLRFKASEKGQQIFYEPLSAPQNLLISREKIWRVTSNLISNAIKFSPTGAPIFVKIVKEDGQVVISVLDNGIGIPEKLQSQVFNMFTTAQRPGTAGEKSFGLGLSICRQIIEKSNGKIWFDSSVRGSVFYISLPLPTNDIRQPDLTQQTGIPQAR